jgi:hypothetical protein
VHDCYLTPDDLELFLCTVESIVMHSKKPREAPTACPKTVNFEELGLKWLDRADLSRSQYNDYMQTRISNKKIDEESCNTDKVACSPCEAKCKTRGAFLVITTCGIVVGFRELFGAESLTQAVMLFLDVLELYEG